MKKIKFYWLIILITLSVSFALPVNAQTKKPRKKAKVVKKKVVRKATAPRMAVKIGEEDLSATSDGPTRMADDVYTPTDNVNQTAKVRLGDKSINPCGSGNNKFKIAGSDNTKESSDPIVNGNASELPKPPYPAAAKAVRASGVVSIQVLIDEEGNVVSADAISGHPLLRAASEKAAREAKFYPTELCGQRVKVSGIITYNFVAQ